MPDSITSIGGRKAAKSQTKKSSKVSTDKSTTGGYNLAPLVSALLLAGIKLSLEQNRKLGDKRKTSKSTSSPKRKTKSTPRPNTV
jgi:hypothetical protein